MNTQLRNYPAAGSSFGYFSQGKHGGLAVLHPQMRTHTQAHKALPPTHTLHRLRDVDGK